MTAAGALAGAAPPAALYPRLLGPAWLDLHPTVRRLHLMDGVIAGRLEFRHGRGWAARLACRALRLPSSGTVLDARLAIYRDAESETWKRMFGRRMLVSIQRGLPDGRLAERFGALELRFRLRVVEGVLTYAQDGAGLRVGGLLISLPRWMAPRVEAREACIEGRGLHVRVGVSAPGIGLVLSYRGCVEPECS